MKVLDAFLLRKPWYIILNHASTQTGTSLKLFERSDLSEGDLRDEEIEFNKANNLIFKESISFAWGKMNDAAKLLEIYWINQTKTETNKKTGKLDFYLKKFITYVEKRDKDTFNNDIDTKIRNNSKKKYWDKKFKNIEEKRKALGIQAKYGIVICDIALIILEKEAEISTNIEEDKRITREIREKFIRALDDSEDFTAIINQQAAFWKSDKNSIPYWFQDSHWIGHQRTNGDPKENNNDENSKWGILKFYIYIGVPTNAKYTPIKILTEIGGIKYEGIGVVTFDVKSKFFIAHLTYRSALDSNIVTPSFFLFPVSNELDQNFAIGYTQYFSQHYNTFIVKTAILLRTHDEFEPKNSPCKSKEFNEIESPIRRFFNNKSYSRLSLPFGPISNLFHINQYYSLQKWMEMGTHDFDSDHTLLACCDEYYVCFFVGDIDRIKYNPNSINSIDKYIAFKGDSVKHLTSNIHVDQLKITFDDDTVEFNAFYNHYQTQNVNSNHETYSGFVRRKGQTLQIVLEDTSDHLPDIEYSPKIRSTIARYILLSFTISNLSKGSAQTTINSYPFFSGIITGTHKKNEPVSYIAVVVKKESIKGEITLNDFRLRITDENKRDELSNKIIQYFLEQISQSKISSPAPSDDFIKPYHNIDIFSKYIGSVSHGPRKTENGDYKYYFTISSEDSTSILNQEFLGVTPEEAKAQADLWLDTYYSSLR